MKNKVMNVKILFISFYTPEILVGAQKESYRNIQFLQKYFGKDNVLIRNIGKHSLFYKIFNPYGFNKKEKKEIEQSIKNGVSIIFMDYFFEGKYIISLKKKFKNLKIIKFFHDINTERLKEFKSNMSLPLFSLHGECRIKYSRQYKAIIQSDRYMVNFADFIIALHKRDENILKQTYGRGADLCLPVSLPTPSVEFNEANQSKNIFNYEGFKLLFIGAMNYFPNREAVDFLYPVIQKLDCKLFVIGTGGEEIQKKYDLNKVVFLGRVDDISQYYLECNCVVTPILSGGGMKVKVCEALSYGKTILGTDEAFVGYEMDINKVGALCNSQEEFENAIKKCMINPTTFNAYSFQVFKDKYSDEATYKLFCEGMEKLSSR